MENIERINITGVEFVSILINPSNLDSKFKNNVSLIRNGIKFENIKIEDGINLSGRYGSNRFIENNLNFVKCDIQTIVFENLNFKKFIIFNLCNVDELNVEAVTFEQPLVLNQSNFGNINLVHSNLNLFEVKENSVIDYFLSTYCSFKTISLIKSSIPSIYFNNSSEIEKFTLSSIKSNILNFQSSSLGEFSIFDSKILQLVFIYSDAKSFGIERQTFIGEFLLFSSTIKEDLKISASKFDKIKFQQIIDINKILINQSLVTNLQFVTVKNSPIFCTFSTIENIEFVRQIIPKESVFNFFKCKINQLYFLSVINFGSIYFDGIDFIEYKTEWKKIDDEYQLDANGAFLLQVESSNSIIDIFNSDLGKVYFLAGLFPQKTILFFLNSKVLEMFIAGSKFPIEITIKNEEENQKLMQQKIGYGQLKKVFENMGDFVTAQEYKAKELEAYRKYLKLEKTSSSFHERANLWVQKYTSNYGTDWFRAFIVTLVIIPFLFIVYSVLLGNYPGWDVERFFTNASYIGEFVNPLYKAEDLESRLKILNRPNDSTWILFARLWNYFSRIVAAFCIYQLIQAFRKHGKSS